MSTLKTVNIQHPSSSTINGTLDTSGNTSFAGNLAFNSGYGSAATAYGCRAWVNFDGTNIIGAGNVSTVAIISAGKYTITFSNPLVDEKYSVTALALGADGAADLYLPFCWAAPVKEACYIRVSTEGGTAVTRQLFLQVVR